ncbi:hypothetical protein KC957_01370 [Candidatus Saccharibacteria bacterium]|nr:hypothetical protein [Candidatus Saccharibacteria bacterium]
MTDGSRVMAGTVVRTFEIDFRDGLPPDPRVDVDLPGPGTWELPLAYFTDAGYSVEDIELGLRFKAETPTPQGLSPKGWSRVMPIEIEGVE